MPPLKFFGLIFGGPLVFAIIMSASCGKADACAHVGAGAFFVGAVICLAAFFALGWHREP
jgi:apolipoprotein N-acyltransferase